MSVNYEAQAVPRIMRAHEDCLTQERVCQARRQEFANTLEDKFWVAMLGDADYELQRHIRHVGYGVISSPDQVDLRFSVGNGGGHAKQPLTLRPDDVFIYLHTVVAAANAFAIFPGMEGDLRPILTAVYAAQISQKEQIEREKKRGCPEYVVNLFSDNSATRKTLFLPRVYLVGKSNWKAFFELLKEMHRDGFITDWDFEELFILVKDEADLLRQLAMQEKKWREAVGERTDTVNVVEVADRFAKWQDAEKRSAKARQSFAKIFGFYYRVAIFGSHRPEKRPDLVEATAQIADAFRAAFIDEGDGGGPGLMEAAGLGKDRARDVRAARAGVSIAVTLSFADQPSQTGYPLSLPALNFLHRLRIFEIIFQVFVAMGGGIGTLLEIFCMGILLLEQSRNGSKRALNNRSALEADFVGCVLLHDQTFWQPLHRVFDLLVEQQIMTPAERRTLFKSVGSEEEAMRKVQRERTRWRKTLRSRNLIPKN